MSIGVLYSSGALSRLIAATSCVATRWTEPSLRHMSTIGRSTGKLDLKPLCQRASWQNKGCFRNMSIKGNQADAGFVFSWKQVMVMSALIAGLSAGFYLMKEEEQRQAQSGVESHGKILIGGDWSLTDMNNKPISKNDFLGQWYFLYFGFCHCPDICPEELEKVSAVMDELAKVKDMPKMKTVFITVDPWRDNAAVMKQYCEEFHPDLIGVTGSVEEVQIAARKFRIYVSKGPVDEDGDYIVDHSILTYLISPDGDTEHYYSNTKTKDFMVEDIQKRITQYNKEHRKKLFGIF